MLVTGVAFTVVLGLLVYVVPQVVQVFEQSRQSLPLMTRALIASSDFLRATWPGLLVLGALALGRAPLSLRMVALAASGVLLIWPEALAGQGSWQGVAAGARWPLAAAGVAGGVLLGYVLSTYSARKLGLRTTGNAGGTEVVLDGDVFGKPTDAADARAMLARLAGGSPSFIRERSQAELLAAIGGWAGVGGAGAK